MVKTSLDSLLKKPGNSINIRILLLKKLGKLINIRILLLKKLGNSIMKRILLCPLPHQRYYGPSQEDDQTK